MSLLTSLLSPVYKPKDNLTATTNPTVNDDITKGYQTGSQWFNQSTTEMYVCISNTQGAAVWEQTTLDITDLGSMALQNANAVAITGGTIDGTAIGGSAAAAGSFTSLGVNGNQTINGTGRRILADMSNATRANRFAFQTSTTNGNTRLGFLPNGTSTVSGIDCYAGTDPDNANFLQVHADGAGPHVGLNSTKAGTGTTRNLVFQIDGVTKAYLDALTFAFVLSGQITAPAYASPQSDLVDGATITPDFSAASNFRIVLRGARTLGVPTNLAAGQTGVISVFQSATGNNTLFYAWAYNFPQNIVPTLSTGKYVFDQLYYYVNRTASSTATMTIATPCVVTWANHGLVSGSKVQFTTTGALPTGVSANTTYWVNVVNANTFNLATTFANLQAGTYVATSGSQSGTHTATTISITLTANLGMGGV